MLELVEGDTLAKRIEDGPLPFVEALTMARQIAEALQAAHDKGIIHRDLKPANIKVTPAGVVKVLDFGLAKTAAGDLPLTDAWPVPTVAGDTRVGVVLGTAAYMSPEQARGQEVDARTDMWAFGCVLFEMLAGRKVFAADAASDSVGKILEQEPDWSCAAEDRRPRRFTNCCGSVCRKTADDDCRRSPRRVLSLNSCWRPVRYRDGRGWRSARRRCSLSRLGGYVWSRFDRRPVASRSDWVQLTNLDSVTQPALSPDGRMLAFIRGSNTFVSPGQLYMKLLPDGEPVALTSDNLPKMGPVFSPDGSRIAYTVNDGNSWDTWDVPALRGEPRRWLRNASGLTWVGTGDLMFSEVKTGSHMAIVQAQRKSSRISRPVRSASGDRHGSPIIRVA